MLSASWPCRYDSLTCLLGRSCVSRRGTEPGVAILEKWGGICCERSQQVIFVTCADVGSCVHAIVNASTLPNKGRCYPTIGTKSRESCPRLELG
jgi:hypothetical protein